MAKTKTTHHAEAAAKPKSRFHGDPNAPMPQMLAEIYQALKGGEQTANVKQWMDAMEKLYPDEETNETTAGTAETT